MKRYRQTDIFRRLVRRTAARCPMARLFGRIQEPIDRFVYRISRGRVTASSWLGGLEVSERERGYRLAEEMFPAFTHYRRWAGNRRIPVLSLEARGT